MVKIKIVNRGRQQLPAYATELSADIPRCCKVLFSLLVSDTDFNIICAVSFLLVCVHLCFECCHTLL